MLLVDDEADVREVLCEMLARYGCSVLTASNADEGLAALSAASPRLLICDIAMPGVDGYGFIDRVRRRPASEGGRIIALALTAFASSEDRQRALRAGYQMHLAKPVDPDELAAALANLAKLAST